VGNWNSSDFSDEDMDQDVQQDIAAAAAQSVGIDMGGYDFGDNFNSSNYSSDILGITNSFMADPNAAARTAMAIRQSYPVYSGNMRPALNSFINRYTTTRGPLTRAAYNSAYDITRTNLGGINTLGYDTAKALQRIGIGSGQVKSADPTAGRLRGTVFKDGVISKGGVNQGVSADKYYGGPAPMDAEGNREYNTYFDKYGYIDPANRALNRAYDQYINPYNESTIVGYNPDVTNLGAGEVRPGLQSGIFSDMSGTPTALGPVATYDRNYSGTDNLAMMAFGTMGHLARALTNKVTGIEGQPLPAAALAPTPEMVARGQTSGGLARSFGQIPGQIKQGIESLIAPNVPAPSPVQTAPLDLEGFEQRFKSTSAAPVSRSSISRNPAQSTTSGEFVRDPAILDALVSGANLSTQNSVLAGEELMAGNQQGFFGFGLGPLGDALGRSAAEKNLSPDVRDFLNEHGMTLKDLMDKDFSKVPDGARLPSGQIMGPEFRTEQRSSLGGPATANQLAFDTTGMSRYGNSYVSKNYGIMDRAANSIPGLANTLRSMGIDIATPPTAKIYSSPTTSNAFSRLIGR